MHRLALLAQGGHTDVLPRHLVHTWEAEADGFLGASGQPGMHREILSGGREKVGHGGARLSFQHSDAEEGGSRLSLNIVRSRAARAT